jgi:DNA-binding XRE family transcriptional regulator
MSIDSYSIQCIFFTCNMEKTIEHLKRLLGEVLPQCRIDIDAPDQSIGNWWIDVTAGKKRITLEYRKERGFGVFHDDAGFGEGPAEIYRTPERAAQRVAQLLHPGRRKDICLSLKDIRELYECSQVELAAKVGVQQSAISRFEQRDEVKLSTLAAAIRALGGELEIRAHFSDSDVPISFKA